MAENWTIKKLLDWSKEYFSQNNIESPQLTAQLLLSEVLSMNRLDLFLKFDQILSEKELASYKKLILRRKNHEPLEYIIGRAQFLNFTVRVSSAVLIPRPETEMLANETIQLIKETNPFAVIDIGTGSGVLAISIKKTFPDLVVWATDISEDALIIAKENADQTNVDISFHQGFFPNSKELLLNRKNSETLCIVSNPPYIRTHDITSLEPEVKENEPMLALDGGTNGLDVVKEIFDLITGLDISVKLLMEIGFDQAEDIKDLAKFYNFKELSFIKDLNKYLRIVRIVK
ncbi:MAG: protein-(glutamine-N5) methyltransferase, release factor-specific [Candidatus Margulisbacteria bacterium GWF2_35_9]|nr:MAG: protein-(glutamine-N5) methyltransferase, release factor-specific [Candidatus Margulisbacteria bacterium GWF2_35_9]